MTTDSASATNLEPTTRHLERSAREARSPQAKRGRLVGGDDEGAEPHLQSYNVNLKRAVPSTGTVTVADCDLPSADVQVTLCVPAVSSKPATGVAPRGAPSTVTLHQPPEAPTFSLPLPAGVTTGVGATAGGLPGTGACFYGALSSITSSVFVSIAEPLKTSD